MRNELVLRPSHTLKWVLRMLSCDDQYALMCEDFRNGSGAQYSQFQSDREIACALSPAILTFYQFARALPSADCSNHSEPL